MTARLLSFGIHSNFPINGTTEYTKLTVATNRDYGKKVNIDLGQNLVYGVALKRFKIISSKNSSSKVLATSRSVVRTEERSSSYRFRTELGDQVKVVVTKKSTKYGVHVEFSSLNPPSSVDDKLVMSWGIFRSDSSCFMPLDGQNLAPDDRSTTARTPFLQNSFGRLAVELDFDLSLAPFYLSFLLMPLTNDNSKSLMIRSHRHTSFCVPVGLGSGYPAPLGASISADGSVNFALFTRSAEGVVLCLYDNVTTDTPALKIDLDPYVNRSGDIWHVSLNSTMSFVSYGYQCKRRNREIEDKTCADRVLLDPYAKTIANCPSSHPISLGQLYKEPTFDWKGDVRPFIPLEKLVVYRLNVRRFTKDKSFSGVAENLQHIKGLGVNAVLLEPIFPFDEKKGPYFPYHFFSTDKLYGDPLSSTNSMKKMVKSLHSEGIEVYLEVVFTHTAEGAALREIDDSSYYHSNGKSNALNCNFPIVQQIILDSLRHWVVEYRIDGFSFVNASYLLRGFHGELLSRPPLVEAIAFDPILSKTKIIADCWDPQEMATKEVRFPHWKRWAETNTKFCSDVRNFLRGEGLLSDLATRLCGSGDIFLSGRGPSFSFNFIARNFGLPLVDLVSFSSSERLVSQLSWNCGEEGPTNKTIVLETRLKQIRNFLFVLFVSLGVPLINMGDECGQSSGGSTAYRDRRNFDWNALKTEFGIQTTQFISFLSALRMRRGDLLQKRVFLSEESIDWHGSDLSPPKWEDPSSRFLAMTLKVEEEEESSNLLGDLFVAFNVADNSECVTLPVPRADMEWLRLVDTALPFPGFFSEDGERVLPDDSEEVAGSLIYRMKSHSCVLFEAKKSIS